MSGRIEVVPPPPGGIVPGLFRWLTDVRAALGAETTRTPTLLNGWTDWGTPYGAVGYWRARGVVRLVGVAKSGMVATDAGGAIFTLPAGFRPGADLQVPVVSAGGPGICYIDTAGNVRAHVGVNTSFFLDGIVFRAGG